MSETGARGGIGTAAATGGSGLVVKEVQAKSALSVSKVYDYTVNPYVGCAHGCTYCYARFMRRFSGHREPWGAFVDVKVNVADLLARELRKKPPGRVWVSGVCDPYQPLEARYGLTRECLRLLGEAGWSLVVQTRSPLVLRDLDLLVRPTVEVGLSVTTGDDDIRRLFEPQAPPVSERIRTLGVLHQAGVRTFAMIAPLLPGAERLPELLADKVDHVLLDRMNYGYGAWVYRRYGLETCSTDAYFAAMGRRLAAEFAKLGVSCRRCY
jgi:DNA repair photolyase